MTDLAAIAAEFTGDGAAALTVSHSGALWRWRSVKSDAPAAWFFVTIDGAAGDAIVRAAGVRRGFASVRVEARVGGSVWRTSLFASKNPPGLLLPIKAAVRKAEALAEGDEVQVELRLV